MLTRTLALVILLAAATAAPAQPIKGGTTWKGQIQIKTGGGPMTVHLDRIVGDRYTAEIVLEGNASGKLQWVGRVIDGRTLAGYTRVKEGGLLIGFYVGKVEDDTMTGTWESQDGQYDGRFLIKRVKD